MALDAVLLSALVSELAGTMPGARIDRVQQPARDAVLLSLYTREGPKKLVISAAGAGARLHYTREKYENPDKPPMFCMLLRKHLTGARIESVTQPGWERLCEIGLTARDELGVERPMRLIAELMGRAANIILVDSAGNIIDALRRLDFGEEAYRRLLPGMIYRYPQPPAKPCFFDLDERALAERIAAAPRGADCADWLLDSFSGLSPLIARELAHRAAGWDGLPDVLAAFIESVSRGEFTPTLLELDGKPKDYSFMSVTQYGPRGVNRAYPGFSELLDAFWGERDRAEQLRRAAHDTVKAVRTLRDRTARRVAAQREELRRSANREELRRRGDLITANLWQAKPGARTMECVDYYAEGTPTVTIELDPRKSAQQNAARAYKEYRKAEAAERHLTALIAEGEAKIDYLESVLDALTRVESERDVREIRAELAAQGVIKPPRGQNNKPRRVQSAGPLSFVSSTGVEILVGRNNVQNDILTHKTARRSDIWLHAQRVHGSHVILRCGDAGPDETSLREAAELAARYSEARDSGKVNVDYTEVRRVKKPSGALPGKVIYTDYRTITVTACRG